MLTHFVSFSSQITAHFSLIFEPIRDQVCLLYPFLRSIHFQILMLLEISILQGTFSPGYLGEPPEPERHSSAPENQWIPSDFLLGNTPAGESLSASWRFHHSAGSFRSLWSAPVLPRYSGLLSLLSTIRRVDRMDSKIRFLPRGRNPLGRLHHPALAKLHTKQLEIWEVQWTQWRIEQQNQSPETGFLRFTQLWRLPQTHFAYLRQASSFSGSFLRFGKCQSREGDLSVMQCTTNFSGREMIHNKN